MTDPSGTPPSGLPAPDGWGSGDMSRTARIDALAGYLRANETAFTRDALDRAAAEAGYEPLEIAAAWAVTAEPIPAKGPRSLVPVVVAIAYVVGTYALTFALAAIPETSGLALVATGVSFALGILAWLGLRETRPDLANAFKIGVIVAFVVPLVIGFVALGVCLVLVTGMGVGG